MSHYTIYTDGSCYASRRAGGWAYVVLVGESSELMRASGYIPTRDPGRCEAEAVRRAIAALPNPALGATIYADVRRLSIERHITIPDLPLRFRFVRRGNRWHAEADRLSRAAAATGHAK